MPDHDRPSPCEDGSADSIGLTPDEANALAGIVFDDSGPALDRTRSRHLVFTPGDTLALDLDDPAQRRFGNYELLELLGEGGTGAVYRARQTGLDRETAVKLLSAGPWASPEFIRRFVHEARNTARMEHPNIITVYEVGCVEGIHYYSMRLIRGASLSALLKRGEMFPPRRAAALAHGIADAVAYAHGLGVLHLDLKPANVLVGETGEPYVTDFGLARCLDGAPAIDNVEVSGTPAYMAPEQAVVRVSKLSAATDIWAIGAILYEMVTGRPPFRGDTAQATLELVLEGSARAPHYFEPGLSADLEAIIGKCLYKDAAMRYTSARTLADDLARFLAGRRVGARPNLLQRGLHWAWR